VIDRTREHAPELRRSKPLLEIRHLCHDLVHDGVVLLGNPELEQLLRIIDVARELLGRLDPLLDAGPLSRDRLRLFRVVPETRGERLFVQAFDFALELRNVKDAPLAS